MKKSLSSPAQDYENALRHMKSENPAYDLVAELLSNSAEKNYGPSLYAVATWYLHGTYFKRNIRTGTRYLIKAAKLGVAAACFDLAVSYENGTSVSKNLDKAFQLYLEACFRGDKQARVEVARCFWFGIGVKTNRNIADSISRFFEIDSYRLRDRQ